MPGLRQDICSTRGQSEIPRLQAPRSIISYVGFRTSKSSRTIVETIFVIVCASVIWAYQQVCCFLHHLRRNSNICNCCSLRLIQRHRAFDLRDVTLTISCSWRCFLTIREMFHPMEIDMCHYKARSIQIIYCVNIHPACGLSQGTFHTTADDDHPHGSFVGQYCQGQAQEITVEVILCKYSRQWNEAFHLCRCTFTRSGAVSVCF